MLNNPPIGNQGTEGSCVGWAVGYTAMGILTYPKFNCWNEARRSPNYVYNQIRVGTGCGGGSFPRDAVNLVRDQGVCSWNLMPYVDGACTIIPNTTQLNDANANRSTNWAALNRNDFLGIKRAIDLGFPVVIGFDVTQDFDNMWSGNGIWTTNNGTSRGGHATCVVGYDDTRQQFKVQNQWGTFGGDNGYFWVTYNMIANNCCREMYIVYGSTPSIPLAISGSDQLCNNNSGTYKINSLQCNSSVSWSTSNTLVTISPSTGSNITVFPNGYAGPINLTATIINSGITTQLSKQIIIGAPVGLGFVAYNYMNFCGATDPNQLNTFSILPGAGSFYQYSGTIQCAAGFATNSTWSLVAKSPGLPWHFDNIGNGTCIVETKSKVPGSFMILRFTASNACGSVSKNYTFTTDCTSISRQSNPATTETTISPNPSTGIFSITVNTTDKLLSIKEIRVKNKMGASIFNKKYSNNLNSQSINIANQPADIYIVEIFDGKNWNTQKINLLK